MSNLLCASTICMNTTKNFIPLHNDSICIFWQKNCKIIALLGVGAPPDENPPLLVMKMEEQSLHSFL